MHQKNEKCFDIKVYFYVDSDTDWLKAVQAMSILGFLTLLCASVMTILKLFVLKDNK